MRRNVLSLGSGILFGVSLSLSCADATPLQSGEILETPEWIARQKENDEKLGISANPRTARYADVLQFMEELKNKFPQNVQISTLGVSDSKREIRGLQIGSGSTHHLLVASHHGNEYGSVEVARGLARSLAENPLPGITVWIVPVLNVTGYDSRNRYESNALGPQDPNRNYPGPCGSDAELSLKSTQALVDFMEREGIVTAATLHTYAPAVVYPWGFSTKDRETPYPQEFARLVRESVTYSKYPVGNSADLIYPADGTFEDFAFWKYGIWSILFELGVSHNPSKNQVVEMVLGNVPGLRQLFAVSSSKRAENHEFLGKCDHSMKGLDRRDE